MNTNLRGSAAIVCAIVIWGATFVGSKVALRHLAPSELAFLRQAFGVLVLLWFASVGGLVQGLAPVVIAVLAVAFLRERLTTRIMAGIVLALIGAVLLAWGTLHVESTVGLIFLFLSVVCWSAYTVIGRHLGDRITAVQAAVLPVCLSVVVFAFGPLFEPWTTAPAGTFALAAVLGFFGSGIAYVVWSYGIARVPAARAGVYSNLVPVVAVELAWARQA